MENRQILFMALASCFTISGAYFLSTRLMKRYTTGNLLEAAKKNNKNTMYVCVTCNTAKRVKDHTEASISIVSSEATAPTGPSMFRSILAALSSKFNVEIPEEPCLETCYDFTLPTGEILTVKPQRCLSACKQANCIAFSHPNKYQYHFATLEQEDIEDLMTFASFYTETSGDAFTKKADRPPRLSKTLLSRIPPPLPSPPLS